METANRVPQRMKNKLLAVLNDATAPKETQNFAVKVLQFYGERDSDPKEDPEVRRMLAEWFSDFIWSGLSSLVEEDGKLVYKQGTPNPKAPGYNPQQMFAAPSIPTAPATINSSDQPIEYEEF
jgi:hypothetical protein